VPSPCLHRRGGGQCRRRRLHDPLPPSRSLSHGPANCTRAPGSTTRGNHQPCFRHHQLEADSCGRWVVDPNIVVVSNAEPTGPDRHVIFRLAASAAKSSDPETRNGPEPVISVRHHPPHLQAIKAFRHLWWCTSHQIRVADTFI
jgi:hypothetical protein